jgi:heptosyltransferase-3
MMRVLLIFPGSLGDLLLLVPAAAALVRHGRQVELSVQRALQGLASRMLPGPAGPAVDGAAMSSLFTAVPAPAVAAWLAGADLVHSWLGAAGAATVLEGARRELGVRAVHRHAVERDDALLHASAAYAAALEVGGPLRMPLLALDPGEWADWWRAPATARLLIHPGAGSAGKRWSASGFRLVADRWRAAGGEVAILLGPAEEDMATVWRAADHRVAAGLGMLEAAALIASAPRYLGNDSGMSHLAGALGRTGVVLFGPTRPERWWPLGGALAPVRFSASSGAEFAAVLLDRLGRPAFTHLDTPTLEH